MTSICGSCPKYLTCSEPCPSLEQIVLASPNILKDENKIARYEPKKLKEMYDYPAMGHRQKVAGRWKNIFPQNIHEEKDTLVQEGDDSFFEKHEKVFRILGHINLGVFRLDRWRAIYPYCFFSKKGDGKKRDMAELCGVTPKTISLDCKQIEETRNRFLQKVNNQRGRPPRITPLSVHKNNLYLLHECTISLNVVREVLSTITNQRDINLNQYIGAVDFCIANGGPSIVTMHGLIRFYEKVSYKSECFDLEDSCLPQKYHYLDFLRSYGLFVRILVFHLEGCYLRFPPLIPDEIKFYLRKTGNLNFAITHLKSDLRMASKSKICKYYKYAPPKTPH
jgi:hypothetical protein